MAIKEDLVKNSYFGVRASSLNEFFMMYTPIAHPILDANPEKIKQMVVKACFIATSTNKLIDLRGIIE